MIMCRIRLHVTDMARLMVRLRLDQGVRLRARPMDKGRLNLWSRIRASLTNRLKVC